MTEYKPLQRDYLVVVDVEATCWKDNKNPPGEQSEIIEIGVCLLNLETLERGDRRSLLLKPTRSKVSPFCTELTSITPEMVEDGMSFAEACAILESDFGTKNRLWGSWGGYDQKMFAAQCPSFGVPYPFAEQHVNLKTLFAEKLSLKRAVGMASALQMVGFPLDGKHHRGDDDAWNIARLTGYVLTKHPDALAAFYEPVEG
ncbi:MAG: 3'-5' exonuclease [bacterium]|nr:3'-5' exonuclease [bacterium]